MHFLSTGKVRDLLLNSGEVISFDFDGPNRVLVSLSPIADAASRLDAHYELRFEVDPPAKVGPMFESLLRSEMPAGSLPGSTVIKTKEGSSQSFPGIRDDGTIEPGITAPMDLLPPAFREFVRGFPTIAGNYLHRSVAILRWRTNQSGPPDPIVPESFQWSIDGNAWYTLPTSFSAKFRAYSALRLKPETKAEIQELVDRGFDEPISHELLREAFAQHHQSPRSALVIGVAACEAGVKLCVRTLVPDAAWLVETGPSPPVEKLLSEYLPNLPVRNRINRNAVAPPDHILKLIKKGVALRNKIAHTGGQTIDSSTCEEILEAILDVLWLCDYYSGHKWAIDFLSDGTKSALGVS